MIRKFNEFNMGSKDKPQKAGVVIQYEDKILLTHATSSSWTNRPLGIPKGGVELGESEKEAAVRELYEEVGISLNINQLGTTESIVLYSKQGKPTGVLTYYVVKINDLSEIGLQREVVPKSMLQLKEIDWAGFVTLDKAYQLIYTSQLIILDRLRG